MRLANTKQTTGLYFLGVLMGLHWVTFFHSMQISSVAIGMLSLYSFPVITVLIEPWFAGKHIKLVDILAAIAVFIGLFIIVFPDLNGAQGNTTYGVLWGVLSALLFSIRNILQKYYFADVSSNSLMLHQVIAISFMLIFFIDIPEIQKLDRTAWGMLILLGILCTATAHTLLAYSLKNFAVKTVSMIGCIQPLLAACFAWIVLHEIPQTSVFIGGFIIIGVAFYESIKSNKD